jgi:hypothetical protein
MTERRNPERLMLEEEFKRLYEPGIKEVKFRAFTADLLWREEDE